MIQQNSLGVRPPFFDKYISLVENNDLASILLQQIDEAKEIFSSIPGDKWLYKYAENKWTIKEVLQHITDTERVFSFRALVFARRDPNSFPSFDENEYAKNANANKREPENLLEEFVAVRKSSRMLFSSFSEEDLDAIGKASTYEMSVKAIGYMIPGHFRHHINILKEKYL